MSTLLDDDLLEPDPPGPVSRQVNEIHAEQSARSAQRLRNEMAAVRLSIHWPGTRKSLTRGQKDQAADTFGAEGDFLTAGKKIVDTSHPAWKACTRIRSAAVKFWQGLTLPWPEPGLRLIKREDIGSFDQQLRVMAAELREAVNDLEAQYSELKSRARERLGELYDPTDYPESLAESFALFWDYPAVEAPAYLRDLCPELYREEQQRIQARFSEAVRLAEEAFVAELSGLIEHLAERLSGEQDGRPKVFRDSAITNLTEFFERFQRLNVTGNDALEELVAEARQVLAGVQPIQLRTADNLRQQVARDLAPIRTALDELAIDRPRRKIIRTAPADDGG